MNQSKFTETLNNIWKQYKAGIIVAVSIATIIFLAGTVARNMGGQTLLAGLTVNVELSEEGRAYLTDGFRQTVSQDIPGDAHLAETEIERFSEVNYDSNLYILRSIKSLRTQQELDYLIMDQVAMETLGAEKLFLDLRNIFTEDELAQIQDIVVYGRYDADADAIPLFLDVTNLPFFSHNCQTEGKIYLSVIDITLRPDAFRSLWAHLNSWTA